MKFRVKKTEIAIGFLILVAVGLSVAIGWRYYQVKSKSVTKNVAVLPVTPTPDPTLDTLLDTPPQNATDEEKKQHFLKVIAKAKDAKSVDISGCKANPIAMFVQDKRPVIIINKDNEAHEISFNKNTQYIVPAKSSESYLIPFAQGSGVYGFGCDQQGTTAGLFVVRP